MRMLLALSLATLFTLPSHAADPCAALKHHEVPASAIALSTRGATVTSAKHHETYCTLRGKIHSVDPNAQPIRFELDLPDTWNGKAVQYGGAAFDGYIPAVREATVLGDKRSPSPLAQGYATFGSDSGHHHHYLLLPDRYNALKGNFAANEEQRKNFASEALKKTHDTVMALLTARYGSAPKRMYFVGGSTGGREAMMVVNRWPADYDGVLAAYAAWNQIESDLQFIRIAQAHYAKGGWLASRETHFLRDTVLKTCDAADGLSDGIVSNPAACNVTTATLRCSDGTAHKGCLSDAQLKTVAAISTPQISAFAVSNGMTTEPGFNILRGADFTGNFGIFHHAFRPALPLLNSFFYLVGDQVLRFFLAKGADFDTLGFNTITGIASDGKDWKPGILLNSAEDDASLADLTPFAQHGGKLLLVHGTADGTIPTAASVLLRDRIVAAMGKQRADDFMRLYLVPGMGHGRGIFDAGFDTVGTLDAWADRNITPERLTATDQNKNTQRSRPLCVYPLWPRYIGSNANDAGSFTCALPTEDPAFKL